MNIKVDFDNIVVKEDKNDFNVKVLMLKGEKGDAGDGEPNVIEKVQVNGTDLPVSNKTVNVPVPTVDSTLSSSSTNPVQNKVINNALSNKADASELNNYYEISEVDELLNNYYKTTEIDTLLDKKIYYFDNVALMKAYDLKEGNYVITKGYYSSNDGGNGKYEIINGNNLVDDGGSIHQLDNDLFAKLIVDNVVNVKQFGAYGDNVHDDTSVLQNVFTYCNTNKINIYIPNGKYIISNSFAISQTYNIIGENKNNTQLIQTATDKEIFVLSNSYITIENIKFTAPENYNNSLIKLSTSNYHIWDLIITNCIIHGTNYTGNGIEINPDNTKVYGLMNTIIKENNFYNLYNAIYINLENNTWANSGTVQNCWVHHCVNGFNINPNGNAISFWNFINFSGQFDNFTQETVVLINNLKGYRNKIDNCELYDGGWGIKLTTDAKYTTIINCKDGYQQIVDLGYMTNIVEKGENRSSTYYEDIDLFIGNITKWTKTGSASATISSGFNSGSPFAILSTGDTANNICRMTLNEQLIYGRNLQARQYARIRFPEITDMRFHFGIGSVSNNNILGCYLKYDASIDNHLHFVQNNTSGVATIDIDTGITLQAGTWYTVQIIRDNRTDKLYLWINYNYIGEIANSNNYNAEPVIQIQTLTTADKKMWLANLGCRTYHYNA